MSRAYTVPRWAKPTSSSGVAVEIGAAVEHQHRLAAGGKQRGDRGALDPVVKAEQHGGRGEGGAGVARGEEGVGPPLLLQGEADDDAGVGLPPDGGEGLFPHADDVRRLVDLEAAPVGLRVLGQLGFDRVGPAHQLHQKRAGKTGQCFERSGDLRLGRLIAPHRVYRDANHAQASSTSSCFLPR